MTSQHANSLSLNDLSYNTNNVMESINFFNSITQKMDIIRALYSIGTKQTPLVQYLINSSKQGKNSIVFTGENDDKSILFITPLLHNFSLQLQECQVLIIVPTNELQEYVKEVHILKVTIITVVS